MGLKSRLLTRLLIALSFFVFTNSVWAEVISTINKTGEDYNTLTLWEDDKDGDLVAETRQETAHLYDDEGDLSDYFTIDGSTTNATYYMKVSSPVGERHDGTASSGAKVETNAYLQIVIKINDPYTVIEWLIIESLSGTYRECIEVNADETTVRNNILPGAHAHGIDSQSNLYCYNNIIYGITGTGIVHYGGYHDLYAFNNSINGCSGYGIRIDYTNGYFSAKNNLCIGNSTADYGATNGAVWDEFVTNGSGDTTGSSGLQNLVADDEWITPGTDHHLEAGATSVGAGTDLGSTADADINDNSRDALNGTVWSLGAHQLVHTALINKTGEDYNTITLWEDARDGDLAAECRQETAACYDDDGILTDGTVDIDGSTTNSLYHLKIYTPSGERHNGTIASGFHWNSPSGYGIEVCNIKDEDVRIEGLIVEARNEGGWAIGVLSNVSEVRISHNVCYTTRTWRPNTGIKIANSCDVGVTKIWDNICFDLNEGIGHDWDSSSTSYIYNNTCCDCNSSGATRRRGIYIGNYATSTWKNNLCNGNTTDYLWVATPTTNGYNASEDATSPDDDYDNVEATFDNEAGDDFTVDDSPNDSTLDDGEDLSTDPDGKISFSDDIEGHTRSAWYIGASEGPAAAADYYKTGIGRGIIRGVGYGIH